MNESRMLLWITAAIVIVLVILAIALNYITLAFYELKNAFFYSMLGVLAFIVGVAVYLSFALPSLAGKDIPFFGKEKNVVVTQDSVQGLELLEE